jgi:hypothetical protein
LGTIKKEIGIGVLVSFLATLSGIFLYLEYFSRFGFYETVDLIQEGELYGKVLSLAIPNLFVFFVYIKKKQDYRAKGVLMVTILIALTTLILTFF